MTRQLMTLALAFVLSAFGAAALAGNSCPFNDKMYPEFSRVCRAGMTQECQDGQWVSLGLKCTSRLSESGNAALTLARRVIGEANLRRDAIIARIAPQS